MIALYLNILLMIFGCGIAQLLPSDIERCSAGDGDCIGRVATDLIKRSGNGRPDLGIPAYEPFIVDALRLQEGSNGPVNLQLNLRDVVIRGISGIKVERVVGFERDPRTSKFEIFAIAPTLIVNGIYKSNGRILVIPVRGEGNFSMTLINVRIALKFKPKVFEIDGKHFADVDKMKILIEPENAKINLDRFLADGNPLGDSINNFFNDNWRDIWMEIYPPISDAMLKIVKDIIREPLKKFAYDDIYLPD